jgi:hypothetical protein
LRKIVFSCRVVVFRTSEFMPDGVTPIYGFAVIVCHTSTANSRKAEEVHNCS